MGQTLELKLEGLINKSFSKARVQINSHNICTQLILHKMISSFSVKFFQTGSLKNVFL